MTSRTSLRLLIGWNLTNQPTGINYQLKRVSLPLKMTISLQKSWKKKEEKKENQLLWEILLKKVQFLGYFRKPQRRIKSLMCILWCFHKFWACLEEIWWSQFGWKGISTWAWKVHLQHSFCYQWFKFGRWSL